MGWWFHFSYKLWKILVKDTIKEILLEEQNNAESIHATSKKNPNNPHPQLGSNILSTPPSHLIPQGLISAKVKDWFSLQQPT